MYDRNYTELIKLWTDLNPDEILINHNYLLTDDKNFAAVDCQNGWIYDKSVFTATVISDVCRKINLYLYRAAIFHESESILNFP